MRNNLRKGNVEMQRKKVRSAGRLGRQAFVPGGLFLRLCGCAVFVIQERSMAGNLSRMGLFSRVIYASSSRRWMCSKGLDMGCCLATGLGMSTMKSLRRQSPCYGCMDVWMYGTNKRRRSDMCVVSSWVGMVGIAHPERLEWTNAYISFSLFPRQRLRRMRMMVIARRVRNLVVHILAYWHTYIIHHPSIHPSIHPSLPPSLHPSTILPLLSPPIRLHTPNPPLKKFPHQASNT